MEYNTMSRSPGIGRNLSVDSGIPLQNENSQEYEATYVKSVHQHNTDSVAGGEPNWNVNSGTGNRHGDSRPNINVKPDINVTPYVSGGINMAPITPGYGHFQRPHPNDPMHGIGEDIQKHLLGDSKMSGSGNVFHINTVNIHHHADPYYGNPTMKLPEPCKTHVYDYPAPKEGPSDEHGRNSASDNVYMRFAESRPSGARMPTEQGSASDETEYVISLSRETKDFVNTNRSSRKLSQELGTPVTSQSERTSTGSNQDKAQIYPQQMTITPRSSADDFPIGFGVKLMMKGSKQYWIGELKPPPTSESSPIPPPTQDPVVAESSHAFHLRLSSEENQTSPVSGFQTSHNRLSSTSEDNMQQRAVDGRLNTVGNSMYMMESNGQFVHPRLSGISDGWSPGSTGNLPGYNKETVVAYPGGPPWNTGRLLFTQSTPDMSGTSYVPTLPTTQAIPPKRLFEKFRSSQDHQCMVEGLFKIHNEKSISNARESLEQHGQDGDWMVTDAVRLPMLSYCLHVRSQNRTLSFPINTAKRKQVTIDAHGGKTFKCLCKLIRYYTEKNYLPSLGLKLATPFRVPTRCSMHDADVSHTHL